MTVDIRKDILFDTFQQKQQKITKATKNSIALKTIIVTYLGWFKWVIRRKMNSD